MFKKTYDSDRMKSVNSRFEQIRLVKQNRHEDKRGFVQKVLMATQCDGDVPRGEVYVTSAMPGQTKGNHYHLKMGEWFSIVKGSGELRMVDTETGAKRIEVVNTEKPLTIYVPEGVAHSLVNTGEQELICVAWAEREHDPEDVYPFSCDNI